MDGIEVRVPSSNRNKNHALKTSTGSHVSIMQTPLRTHDMQAMPGTDNFVYTTNTTSLRTDTIHSLVANLARSGREK